MGGSGGNFHSDFDSKSYLNKVKNSTDETDRQNYDADVANEFSTVLGQVNNRDTEAINTHISEIKSALQRDVEDGEIKTNLGGSLARRTHINGISDVDILVILNDTELANKSPDELLDYFCDRLKERFPNTKINQGDTAVTVSFADMDIQLLPAIKEGTGVKIPDGKSWSDVVNPKEFANNITELNKELNNTLLPTIKLAKAILSKLPDSSQMSGYHIESLALKIFKQNPPSSRNYKDLLKHFFSEASKLVKTPIKDITGQSDYVDEYFGPKNSAKRRAVANYLDRITNKMEYADTNCIQTDWAELLDF